MQVLSEEAILLLRLMWRRSCSAISACSKPQGMLVNVDNPQNNSRCPWIKTPKAERQSHTKSRKGCAACKSVIKRFQSTFIRSQVFPAPTRAVLRPLIFVTKLKLTEQLLVWWTAALVRQLLDSGVSLPIPGRRRPFVLITRPRFHPISNSNSWSPEIF